MRQTFEVPKLDPNHRYRIVVGGAGHAWSGEGFALYLNGKLVSEATGGYYKSGGHVRGALVLNDLLPEFANGKVTLAVKSFLRRNGFRGKAAPASGHLSVWMESAKLDAHRLGYGRQTQTLTIYSNPPTGNSPHPHPLRTHPMKMKTMTTCLTVLAAVTLGTAGARPAKEQPAPLSGAGQKLEGQYSSTLTALKAEIAKALPTVAAQKKAALDKAGEDAKKAEEQAAAAQAELGKVNGGKALIDHAKNKWIGGAEKGIAEAEAALKKATTDAEREAAQKDLAKWQANKEDGLKALKERDGSLRQGQSRRTEVDQGDPRRPKRRWPGAHQRAEGRQRHPGGTGPVPGERQAGRETGQVRRAGRGDAARPGRVRPTGEGAGGPGGETPGG